MAVAKRILVTGATGKAGRRFIDRVLSEAGYETYSVRALCHNRTLDPRERLDVVRGSIADRAVDEPVDYRRMGDYLAETRGYHTVEIPTQYHSTWLDNAKAKFLLGWRPRYDLKRLIDAAFDYQRAADDPRIIWYPG